MISPQIRWSLDDFFLSAQVDENGVLSTPLSIELENEGFLPFTVTGLSAEVPGLRLLPAGDTPDEPDAVTVNGGDLQVWTRRVVITDCAAVPREPQPVRFTYTTWMGPGSSEVIWKSGQLTVDGRSVPIAWQRGLAGKVCNDAMSPDLF
ncbi:hypothetical protein [Nonomuraea sp. NPDC050691]|uniref:hypothetical protein n=1 Tax=Nonomuraea sp. NPDC050691 TaxID=3155661 RepID=UPI0033D2CEBB